MTGFCFDTYPIACTTGSSGVLVLGGLQKLVEDLPHLPQAGVALRSSSLPALLAEALPVTHPLSLVGDAGLQCGEGTGQRIVACLTR
jgi:hypothetical protein